MTNAPGDVAVAERTVLDRLMESGITQERAVAHIRGGWVLVDGERVTDPASPAGYPARVEFRTVPRSLDR